MKTLTLSILQFNTFVKNILDAEEFLSNISVFGEVTNFKISGNNAYFDLKDENAMLSCVKFGADGLSIKNGDLITVFGKVNYYVKSGRINFVVSRTQAYGMGDLYQKFLELKNRLESEGYFRDEIKKAIPHFSKKIGVVTSETGAVIRDIINVTRKKNKFTDIVVYPSKVQGVGAEDELSKGIEYFNTRDDFDVIIVARGGGSLEDLSPFNTEKIVRAIYNSKIPIISAVGHETDFTLCDFAADLRVPTPSVAAEVAVFDYEKEVDNIKLILNLMYDLVAQKLINSQKKLVTISDFLEKNTKINLVDASSKIKEIIFDIELNLQTKLKDNKTKLEKTIEVLSKLNPLEILKNGYSVVEKNGKKVSGIDEILVDDEINIILKGGKIKAKVCEKEIKEWHLKNLMQS